MEIFTEITILVVAAAVFALIMRALKQPLMIGYIITGLVVGPVFLNFIHSQEALTLFSEIGIAFLLFIVGLNLTPRVVKTFGKVALIAGLGQVAFTFGTGWLIARGLGFSMLVASYISIALVFSSTIIIVKLLSDKGDLEKLYAKIAISFLVVQDIVAILILFLVPMLSRPAISGMEVAWVLLKGVSVAVGTFIAAEKLLPHCNRFIAKSQELMLLFAIAWGLGCAALFRAVGFSLESGALMAGVTLAILPSHDEIHARMKPLRDFFIVLFFILLGAKITLTDMGLLIKPAVLLSLFVIIGNPIILMVIMGALGYRKKTSFQTGLTVAQISEFSFIIMVLGERMGHINQMVSSLVTFVGLITIFVSSYIVMHAEALYVRLAPLLSIFERASPHEPKEKNVAWDTVLFGFNRIGFDFIGVLKALKGSLLVVDYNPDVIEILEKKRVPCRYGDAGDIEFLHMINMSRVKLAISTIPDSAANKLILSCIRSENKNAIVLGVAYSIEEALSLYREGFDYVIMPHFLGGLHASLMVEKHGLSNASYARLRRRHLAYLRARQLWGHDHPLPEKVRR